MKINNLYGNNVYNPKKYRRKYEDIKQVRSRFIVAKKLFYMPRSIKNVSKLSTISKYYTQGVSKKCNLFDIGYLKDD